MTIEKAIKIIKDLDGVLDVRKLSHENKKDLIRIESSRKNNIIPVVNEGLEKCLKNDVCLVILKNENFRPPSEPTILLVTENGELLGQEIISIEDKEKFKKQDNVYFLSKDFVIFKREGNVKNLGHSRQLFLLPAIPFPELEEIKDVFNVVSCSPSTLGDAYLKKQYECPEDPHVATIIVGFTAASG